MKNSKKISLMSGLLLLHHSIVLGADELAGQSVDPGRMQWMIENGLLIFGGIFIIGTIAFIVHLLNLLLQVQKMRLIQEHGGELLEKVGLVEEESFLERWYKKMIGTIPIAKEKEILFDHEYDGIRELDNNLPPWWLAMFYISIVFGFAYMGYYHYYDYGLSSVEAYEQEMEFSSMAVAAYLDRQSDKVSESNVVALMDEASLATGQRIYKNNCSVCHLDDGGGQVGPNLTDAYWLHGGGIANVFKTIKYGVPAKGMIAWKTQLRPSEIQLVASYILSMEGTNPANPKEPQGEKYVETETGNE